MLLGSIENVHNFTGTLIIKKCLSYRTPFVVISTDYEQWFDSAYEDL